MGCPKTWQKQIWKTIEEKTRHCFQKCWVLPIITNCSRTRRDRNCPNGKPIRVARAKLRCAKTMCKVHLLKMFAVHVVARYVILYLIYVILWIVMWMFCEVILGVSFSNKRGLKINRVGIADNFKAIDSRLSVENILPIRQKTALDTLSTISSQIYQCWLLNVVSTFSLLPCGPV